MQTHERFMQIAINMAKANVGSTGSNPSVGCIIVKNGRIIATSCTAEGGVPHAEPVTLERAGKNVNGSDLYVTLEPCSHFGKTPPCVDAIIKAKVKKVIIGSLDKNPKVSSIKKLKENSIEVITGVLEEKTNNLHKDFFKFITKNIPYITIKVATSLDGKISTYSGDSKWITNELARNFAHKLRSQNNAILIGRNTFEKDAPSLNTRLLGLEKNSPQKFIISKTLKKAPEGFSLLDGNLSLLENLKILGKKGVQRLLVEGGTTLITSLIKEDLVDELVIIKAPIIIGGEKNFIQDIAIKEIKSAKKLERISSFYLQDNVVDVFALKI